MDQIVYQITAFPSQQFLHFTHPTRAWVSSNQDVRRLKLYQTAMCFLFGKVKLSLHKSQNSPFLTPQDIYSQYENFIFEVLKIR
jgi:hypothetical protein